MGRVNLDSDDLNDLILSRSRSTLKLLLRSIFKIIQEFRWLLTLFKVFRWFITLDFGLEGGEPVVKVDMDKVKSCCEILGKQGLT